jgi:hypothetical protein
MRGGSRSRPNGSERQYGDRIVRGHVEHPEEGGQITAEDAQRIVLDAARRYFDSRRARVNEFVDRHFSLAGSAKIHRKALGWDVLKAPANFLLALPNLGMRLMAAGAQAVGAKRAASYLRSNDLLLATAVGREIEWLITTELLELPFRQGQRESRKDALADMILSAPELQSSIGENLRAIARRADDPRFRKQLEEVVATYTGTRAAAADITASLITLGGGAVAVKQAAPGVLTLGPVLAAAMAQQAAIASFPLGVTLGGLWYGMFPAAASPTLIASVTCSLLAVSSVAGAFAGIVADPVQRVLGIHRRRLLRLTDVLERRFSEGNHEAGLLVRDHYVARLLDLLDLLGSAYRMARP